MVGLLARELSGRIRQPGDDYPVEGAFLHKGEPGTNADLACGGWLAQFAADHIGVRLAAAEGRLPDTALEPGDNWPPLYETWEDVVHAQTPPAW